MSILQLLRDHEFQDVFFFYFCTASGVQSSAVIKEDLVVSYRDPVSFQRSKGIQNAYMEVGDPMQDLDT